MPHTAIMPAAGAPVNFENAAESSVKAVVHIKSITNERTVTATSNDMFSQLFGPQQYVIPSQQEIRLRSGDIA